MPLLTFILLCRQQRAYSAQSTSPRDSSHFPQSQQSDQSTLCQLIDRARVQAFAYPFQGPGMKQMFLTSILFVTLISSACKLRSQLPSTRQILWSSIPCRSPQRKSWNSPAFKPSRVWPPSSVTIIFQFSLVHTSSTPFQAVPNALRCQSQHRLNTAPSWLLKKPHMLPPQHINRWNLGL